MSQIIPQTAGSLVARAAELAELSEEDRRRFALEAARDRDAAKLWALTEAHLTLHGAAGAHVSAHTLATYHYGVTAILKAWQGENLLRPSRNAGVMWVRALEDKERSPRLSTGTVRSRLSGAKALYTALRWSGATEANPFQDVRPARDTTPAWAKREAYEHHEVRRLEAHAYGANLFIVLLGAHAGLRVSEMTALRWEDIDLGNGRLRVHNGKGGKAATVVLSRSLVTALEQTPSPERTGYVLPCRSRQSVYERLGTLCKTARVEMRGVHALRHAAGTRLRAETGDIALVADHLRHATLETARGYAKSNDAPRRKTVGEW